MKTFFFSAPTGEFFTPFPFNELILSWNGFRPKRGQWSIYVSLFDSSWSPYVKYAEWGATGQKTFEESAANVRSHQDVVNTMRGFAKGFRFIVEGEELHALHSVFVFCRDAANVQSEPTPTLALASVRLEGVIPHSQMTLSHPRHRDLCSPTSTTAAINFLLKRRNVDPLQFTSKVHDSGFDIYGNWILNTAAAYEALGGNYQTYVARLPGFSAVHDQLTKGLPVVVSVKGTLPGARIAYPNGHLILITGYSSEKREIHCMDPAFNTDPETLVTYPLEPFLEAWGTRRNLAYIVVPVG